MIKRKALDTATTPQTSPTKKQRTSTKKSGPVVNPKSIEIGPTSALDNVTDAVDLTHTPSRRRKRTIASEDDDVSDADITPRPDGRILFATPSKRADTSIVTPSKSGKADRSAKRKSAQTLINTADEDDWDNSNALAREILDEEPDTIQSRQSQMVSVEPNSAPVTPSKRGRGRPAGAKNKRSPTPEGDLAPEERYFFQNRMGPPRVSSNIFTSLGLPTHDEYFELMRNIRDSHESERAYLMKLHARSFPQWKFELDEGFGVCLYGYGSKKRLTNNFAEWLYPRLEGQPRIVMVNGYAPRVNLRGVLNTIASALVEPDEVLRLSGQPHDMVDIILTHLAHHVEGGLVIVVNSVDAAAMRKSTIQSVLARLAAHPKVSILATADTPTFPILWNSTFKDQFRFLFHDCTTFAAYEVETNPVDDVNELLGRKNRRVGGKEGIGFVLKSLPDNARNLYRVLLTEILTVVNDGADGALEDDDHDEGGAPKTNVDHAEEIGIEYRALYQKASEEFICSSDMNFRFLLKEFHDHQMLTSKRDGSGVELLSVPLPKDEMEAVLEDLVLG